MHGQEVDDMDTWEALEELMDEGRWSDAAAGVRELLDAWRGMKAALLWFASDEVDAEAERFEQAALELARLLELEPVDAQAVDAARQQVRAFAGQGGS